uniref:Uncharacterized protein n=1 Tax=Anopheles melas TaxID=34690 RepID=A0A182U7B3_9DIPT
MPNEYSMPLHRWNARCSRDKWVKPCSSTFGKPAARFCRFSISTIIQSITLRFSASISAPEKEAEEEEDGDAAVAFGGAAEDGYFNISFMFGITYCGASVRAISGLLRSTSSANRRLRWLRRGPSLSICCRISFDTSFKYFCAIPLTGSVAAGSASTFDLVARRFGGLQIVIRRSISASPPGFGSSSSEFTLLCIISTVCIMSSGT